LIAIASYPRSGNHLVRFVVEYITGRSTLGCFGNPEDVPIFRNIFPDDETVLDHVQDPPIGCKAHTVDELEQLNRMFDFSSVIFIRREPHEAILAHVEPSILSFLFPRLRREFKGHVSWYFNLLHYYSATDVPKVQISYESLISPNDADYLPEIDKIADILRAHADDTRVANLRGDFERLRQTNATAQGRGWSGVRSGGDPAFYQNTIDRFTYGQLTRAINERVQFTGGDIPDT
jgi:hypothetical protein